MRKVAGGVGIAFEASTLAERMREVLAMSPEERAQMGLAAAERVRERYSWDAVTDAYERLFREMLAG
jgi:glycosyltransferase involved in cell wall biosynthesis